MGWQQQAVPDVLKRRIYEVVQQVPAGLVATYGDIAAIVGGGVDARTVGYALNEIPKQGAEEVPWQRIINAQGGISTKGLLQRKLLEDEGIVFEANDRIALSRYRWRGPTVEWATEQGFNTLPSRDDGDADQLSLL
jgi:methylated-DNA-protein-cysteine methyltransferase related protein